MTTLQQITSCMDAYDPDALAVDQARAVVRAFLTPVATNERVAVRSALGRVLGEDIVSTLDVPAHDNSAMDGYALLHADLAPQGDTVLRLAGSAYAGRQFEGKPGKGECVRIMTGAVVPQGACVMCNISPKGDLKEAASNLFAMLRSLDKSGASRIAVMPIPDEGLGEAINDRLRRASVQNTKDAS